MLFNELSFIQKHLNEYSNSTKNNLFGLASLFFLMTGLFGANVSPIIAILPLSCFLVSVFSRFFKPSNDLARMKTQMFGAVMFILCINYIPIVATQFLPVLQDLPLESGVDIGVFGWTLLIVIVLNLIIFPVVNVFVSRRIFRSSHYISRAYAFRVLIALIIASVGFIISRLTDIDYRLIALSTAWVGLVILSQFAFVLYFRLYFLTKESLGNGELKKFEDLQTSLKEYLFEKLELDIESYDLEFDSVIDNNFIYNRYKSIDQGVGRKKIYEHESNIMIAPDTKVFIEKMV